MPRKKKTSGTISQDDGLKKLQAIKETLPPPLPEIDLDKPEGQPGIKPGIAMPEPEVKPVSGIFKSLYPLVIDLLCHVLNKEKFDEARKEELLASVSQDLDELERRYIPETVQNMPGVKALSITGLAIAFQPKAKKEPKKEPEPSQPEPVKEPEKPAAPSALDKEVPVVAQPGQPA